MKLESQVSTLLENFVLKKKIEIVTSNNFLLRNQDYEVDLRLTSNSCSTYFILTCQINNWVRFGYLITEFPL